MRVPLEEFCRSLMRLGLSNHIEHNVVFRSARTLGDETLGVVVEDLGMWVVVLWGGGVVGDAAMVGRDATAAKWTVGDGRVQKMNRFPKRPVSSGCSKSPIGAPAGVFSRPLRGRDFQRQ